MLSPGLWIHINFLRIRIHIFLSMQIPIRLNKICKKLLYEELKKTKKSALKLKNHRAGPDILHKKKLQLLPIFLPLFCFFPPKFLTTGSGSRMENECESMRVWIHSPGSHYSFPQYSTKKQRTQTYRKNLFTPVWNKT